jgi:biotin carboxylase
MSITGNWPLAIYHEHPQWFGPLFAELEQRGVPYQRLSAARHRFDPAERDRYALVFNRMSPSAYRRGAGQAIAFTTAYLAHLERQGVRVVNGHRAWQVEISKALQLSLLEGLGLPYPRSRIFDDPADVLGVVEGLRFPVVVKPNVGGSGAGIQLFDTVVELGDAVARGLVAWGIDGTVLVQEYVRPEAGRIVRVEVLGGRYLYAIRVYAPAGTFDLCPADACRRLDGVELSGAACAANAAARGLRVEAYEPPAEVVAQVEAIAAAAGIEVGGVEYLVDADGRGPFYYDINALSNFVADAPRVVGFDPFGRLVDYLLEAAAAEPAISREEVA